MEWILISIINLISEAIEERKGKRINNALHDFKAMEKDRKEHGSEYVKLKLNHGMYNVQQDNDNDSYNNDG